MTLQTVDKWRIIWYRIKDYGTKEVYGFLRIEIMGVGFDNVTMTQALERSAALLDGDKCTYCVTPNAEIVYEAVQDASFCKLLNEAGLVLPDGAGVILGSKLLGTPLQEKVAGIEYGDQLCGLLARRSGRLYLLGGKPGIAELAAQTLQRRHPGLIICGTADGYFRDEAAVVKQVRDAGADVVFVCLGAPKQEKFMKAHVDELGAKLLVGLGGSLDGYAGTVKRAPRWMITCNLEWLYRLMKEPRRLGRMMRLPKFVLLCLREKRRKNG